MLSRQDFNRGWALLLGAYPEYLKDRTPDQIKGTLEVYWSSLKDFDPKDFERVIQAHIFQKKFFPRISELREELVLLRTSNRATAAEAWLTALQAAERDRKPEGDEALTAALRVFGGWERYRLMSYREIEFRFKDFERAYNSAIRHEDRLIQLGQDHRPQLESRVGRLALEDLGK